MSAPCSVCARQHDARGCRGPLYRIAKAPHDRWWHIFRRRVGAWEIIGEGFTSRRAAQSHLRKMYAEGVGRE